MSQFVHLLLWGAMVFLLEDGIGLDVLEFGLEVGDDTVGAAIGTTTGVGESVAIVLGLGPRRAPGRRCQLRQMTEVIWMVGAYQLPLPPPSFFTFLGSASA